MTHKKKHTIQNSYSAGHTLLQVRLDVRAWFPEISWEKNNGSKTLSKMCLEHKREEINFYDVEQVFKIIAAYLPERTFKFTTVWN